MRINTNVMSIDAQRNLMLNQMSMGKSVERLSSGLRINRAADDAAGLTISEKLRGQVRGLNQAVRNAQDGISLIQTAEGALNEVHSSLQRMRELAIQGANDTLTSSDRDAIAKEMSALKSEIDRIADTTEFNTKKLLKGGLSTTVDTTSGLKQGNVLVANAAVSVSNLDVSGAKAGATYTISSAAAGTLTLTNAADATDTQTVNIVAMVASTDPDNQTLDFSRLGIKVTLSGRAAANTTANMITDLVAKTNVITNAASGAAQFQIGANQNQTLSVSVGSTNTNNLGNVTNGATTQTLDLWVGAFATNLTTTDAQNLIKSLDKAIGDVSSNRSSMGAVQNRLEITISNLSVASENLTSSESRIRDADFAKEMAQFTKAQILNQAGTAILSQANQVPQGILSLLR